MENKTIENIAIIITKLNGGGAERAASNLSIELSKRYNIILIVFDGRNITYPYKGTLIDLKIKDSNSFFERVINVFKRVMKVRKIKNQYKIQCSISLLDGPNIVNVMSRIGERTIVSIRDRLSSETVSKLRRKLIIYSSMKSDLTVCLSKMVERDMKDVFGIPQKKLAVVYNHVDAELLRSLSQNCEKPNFIKNNQIYITTMGRLNHQKGQWHLIRAFKHVTKEIPNINLIIMGEGELKNNLQKLADDLDISDKVIFTGYIKNPHNVLRYSEMFVFSSLFEGLGNVLLEALSFDMPIISTDCIAGPREILAPGTDLNKKIDSIEYGEYGILTPTFDDLHFDADSDLTKAETVFADAIIKLHFNSTLKQKYSEKAKQRIKYFDKNRITEQWCKCISNNK